MWRDSSQFAAAVSSHSTALSDLRRLGDRWDACRSAGLRRRRDRTSSSALASSRRLGAVVSASVRRGARASVALAVGERDAPASACGRSMHRQLGADLAHFLLLRRRERCSSLAACRARATPAPSTRRARRSPRRSRRARKRRRSTYLGAANGVRRCSRCCRSRSAVTRAVAGARASCAASSSPHLTAACSSCARCPAASSSRAAAASAAQTRVTPDEVATTSSTCAPSLDRLEAATTRAVDLERESSHVLADRTVSSSTARVAHRRLAACSSLVTPRPRPLRAAFARLAASRPIPASPPDTRHHSPRASQLNRALHTILAHRRQHHPATLPTSRRSRANPSRATPCSSATSPAISTAYSTPPRTTFPNTRPRHS